uniref:Glycosyltransferase n=1 Tax=Aegilops tauschii subsp. strangulata TaxID=200361 RepID=A0A453QHP0_AEGTS
RGDGVVGGSRAAARRDDPLPGAGPHHADAEAGQAAPHQGLPRHLRQQRVQPPPPSALPVCRQATWPARVPVRCHRRRPSAVRPRGHAGHRCTVLLYHDHLPPQAQGAHHQAQRGGRDLRRRAAACDLRGGRWHHVFRPCCRARARPPLRHVLGPQRLWFHGLLLLQGSRRPWPLPSQRYAQEAQLTNGYLDTIINWIPSMPKDLRLRDLPSFVRTTDADDIMFNFFIHETTAMSQASAVIINTFDELDAPLLDAMSKFLPPIYTVGPLHLTVRNNVPEDSPLLGIRSNLWKEQDAPLRWLDDQPPRSVVYVNFGSITVMSNEHLLEFAWGLANSGYTFLWNVRPDLVKGHDNAVLPLEVSAATEGRSMLSTWCPQEKVLEHEAVGVFLTHSGWNSSLEGICGGVPMVCWPFFTEQQTNCRYKCTEWGIGMEIGEEVTRTEVKAILREAMEGEKGQEMRRRALKLQESAVASAQHDGRSMRNVDRLIQEVLLA